ncbi:spike base protein, RCAP_Rcc01079 family [Tateyamaria sp. SN6-1]|uniref:spike base protein, RCAP_Rcc01079 family n=1 Tax=Tateyamaria sp. SN6-1 TaxID=3092148 RepID=UPI0039F560F6
MPISDQFQQYQPGLSSPVQGGFDVTPADGADLAQVTRAVMVSGAGDVAVTLKNGDALTLPGLTPGVIYPLREARVWATGTTATGVKGLV